MLRRIQRVSNKQFEEVMKKGKIVHSTLFLARMIATSPDSTVIGKTSSTQALTRIAAVMPVKIGKTAVIRNKTRRQIYEAVRPFASELKTGFIIAIFAKAPALTASTDEIRVGVRDLFVKAGLLR